MMNAEDWDGVTKLCEQAVQTALGFSFAHVGLNCDTAAYARSCADQLAAMFSLMGTEGNSSIFTARPHGAGEKLILAERTVIWDFLQTLSSAHYSS